MIRYLGRILVGGLLTVAFFTNGFNVNSKTDYNKNIHYANFKYTDNVKLHKTKGLELEYSANLRSVGDFYEIEFDVVNETNVDMVVNELYCPEDDEYIHYTFTYIDGSKIKEDDELKKGETKRIKFRVDYVEIILEDNYTFDSSFTINYEQKI